MAEEYIEVSAKTLEDAITQACQKLSVTSDMLDVDVVDQGSSGFLGFNARPAVIRAKAKETATKADHVQGDVLSEVHQSDTADEDQTKAKSSWNPEEDAGSGEAGDDAPAGDPDDYASRRENRKDEAGIEDGRRDNRSYHRSSRRSYGSSYGMYGQSHSGQKNYVAHSRSTDDFLSTSSDSSRDRDSRRGRRSRQNRYDRERNHGYSRNYDRYEETESFDVSLEGENVPDIPASHPHRHDDEPKVKYTDEQIALFKKRAEDFLQTMFQAMKMEVTITSSFDPEENILNVDFEGEDMGVLIGKRGQTLDSIQYLVSLIVNKGVPGYVHVKADTENYRERRKQTLENLAKNMAAKVKRTRKAQALEPMNPYERRIIHSALQNDRYVTTYSEGEDPYRRVVITLKK